MQHPNLDHPRHDVTLIAGHAAGDLIDSERARAETLLATCHSCADLHRDLLAIAAATRSLPAPATVARDFRLDAEQAARLRRGSWLRAALRPFSSPRSATRPLAAALTSLGLAGLLAAAALPGLLGSPASGGMERAGASSTSSSSAPAAAPGATTASVPAPVTPVLGPVQAGATPSSVDYGVDITKSSAAPGDGSTGVKAGPGQTSESRDAAIGGHDSGSVAGQSSGAERLRAIAQPNLLVIGSLALLAAGVLLFGLRFASRRIR